MKFLKVDGIIGSCLISFLYFIPNLLPAVTFTTFIALGNYLDLATATTSLIFFSLITYPMI